MRINERIRHLREREELGREEFCKKCGIVKHTLIKIEQGQVKTPSYDVLQSICLMYPKHVFFLLGLQLEYPVEQLKPRRKAGRKSGTPNRPSTDHAKASQRII